MACSERPIRDRVFRDAAVDAGKDCHSDEMDCAIAIPPNRTRREHGELYMGARPMIVRNPPNDRHFELAVESVLSGGVTDPAAAQELLRQRYPKAVVRPRELAGERTPVWYVYRDGRWTRGD